MRLNELKDKSGAKKDRMRVGRGIGSGKGKTAGRGHKGAKSRSGYVVKGFEGGQMPIHMRLPKRGFTMLNGRVYGEVNIGRLQKAIDAGKLDAKKPIDEDVLVAAGVARKEKDGVRLLGKGAITSKVTITVAGASKAAVAAVEKAGGSVTLTAPVKSEEKTSGDA
ncbi:50S ribosomal protein L15 [Iodidimonas gelatinilytica]|uniref:Large ribosomal subunit protein uL15 n=1 Tax=Iodidimonas gelatinilytica TaxID=1236966 RepID=A0A5A7N4F9_9PROT|nr:50S ribosomal protein L15 [Iodidimonas gelatinilytica]GEQ99165.1 50S ribosomal protein L15 [Iodidimonas gelatinilytica]GER01959.1 50S ribosomal protein L15 [Iodidimonas gelatinilytica]